MLTPDHYSDITRVSFHLKPLATWLFVQKLVQANNKENMRALHYWPFVWGIHQGLVDSPHKWQVMQKAFPCHDIITYLYDVLTRGEDLHNEVSIPIHSVGEYESIRVVGWVPVKVNGSGINVSCLRRRLLGGYWKKSPWNENQISNSALKPLI